MLLSKNLHDAPYKDYGVRYSLTRALPLQTELETPDIERTRTFVASPTGSFCHSSGAVIVKQRTSPDDRSPSSVSIAIRHTDV
ncbi:uncharacterized protein TNCV_4487301 [Trichonephila clavipes]|nr:uncharacterized protein TNCV_4487301 [Trichonephila clavipes]